MSTHITLIQGEAVSTHVLDSEGSECLVTPQLPLALCGDQPGHTEWSCVNFTGVHKNMVRIVISIVSSLAYVVCVYMHTDTQLYYISVVMSNISTNIYGGNIGSLVPSSHLFIMLQFVCAENVCR